MNRVRGARWPQRSVNSAQKAYATLATHRSITVIYGWLWAGWCPERRTVSGCKIFCKIFHRLPYFSIFLSRAGRVVDALRSSNFTFYMARLGDLNRLSYPSYIHMYKYIFIYIDVCVYLSLSDALALCGSKFMRPKVFIT